MSTQSRVLIILLLTLDSSLSFSFFSSHRRVEEVATTVKPRPGAMKLCDNNFEEALNMVCVMRRRRKRSLSTFSHFQSKCCNSGCTFAELNNICNPF